MRPSIRTAMVQSAQSRRGVPGTGKWRRLCAAVATWAVSAAFVTASPVLLGCSSEEVVVKTADGVSLSAKDIDNNPLALLPGGSLGTFTLDAPKLFASPAGTRLLEIVRARLPVPPEAGFVPERDLSSVLLGIYSFQGVDFMGVATGNFNPEAIEASAKAQQTTPLGTPLVRVEYAKRVFYVSANIGFVVLTSHTVLFGNETGIRRGLDRLEAGRVAVEVAPQIESLLRSPGAPLAFGSDAEYDPQVTAFASQLPFLKEMSLLRAVGNFDAPGVNIAGTLTYKTPVAAEQGKAALQSLQQNLAAYGFLASVLGLAQPIQRMDLNVVESSLQVSIALDGQAAAGLLNSVADVMGAGHK